MEQQPYDWDEFLDALFPIEDGSNTFAPNLHLSGHSPGQNNLNINLADIPLNDHPPGEQDFNINSPKMSLNDHLLEQHGFNTNSVDIPLSNLVEIDPQDQHDFSLFLQLNSNNNEDAESLLGDLITELNHVLPDMPQDAMAIVDDEQLLQNPSESQNFAIVDNWVLKQATGSQDGIMYLMYPMPFGSIAGTMFVTQQPKANKRSRYECDGRRFLPDSRFHPMTVQLPHLQTIALARNQIIGIVVTIVTSANNPMSQQFVHENDIIYHEADAIKIGHGCVFIPLKTFASEKKFPRMSIHYKKYEEYKFDLTPFDKNTMFGTTSKFMLKNESDTSKVPKAKIFKQQYDLSSYQFIFHLALKEDNVVYISNITCDSDVIHEQIAPADTSEQPLASASKKNSVKRVGSPNKPSSSKSKKLKSSPALLGLPITRVSTNDTEYDVDHPQ
ncbi:unnamed protein product [Adineta steineri]|uniref:Uncharacterized protein n=2 Tax=Adineta steineri TaxID=433720 RepID=A0A814C218_9BILA|nr:unnamed protein product [Adineta steineri]